MADDGTKAALARLRGERRALVEAKKGIFAEIREVRVRHRPSAHVAGGWRKGSAQQAAYVAELAEDRARLAAALAPHEARLADTVAAIERIEAAISDAVLFDPSPDANLP